MKNPRIIRKAVAMLLMLSLVFSFGACSLFKGSLELKSFQVDQSSVTTEYYIGDTVDFSGIKVKAVYSDETLNKTLTYDDLTFSDLEGITDTEGKKTVTVYYTDEDLGGAVHETSFVITVREDPNAVKHISYYVDASEMTTEYDIGDTLSYTGLKLYEKWSNGTTTEVSEISESDLVLDTSNVDMETIGQYTILVTYKGESAGTIAIEVGEIPFTAALSGTYQTSCEVGQSLDLSGLTVTVTYEDSTVKTIANADLTISAVDTSTAGDKSVTVSYTDPVNEIKGTLTLTVSVIEAKKQVTSLAAPLSIEKFLSTKAAAGSSSYGTAGFENIFIDGSSEYVVGNDNSFIFLPSCYIFNDEAGASLEAKSGYYASVELALLVDGTYVTLTKTPDTSRPTDVSYYNGDVLIAKVDTYLGHYDFTDAALGQLIKISVLPSADHYKIASTVSAIELTVSVIDAFNVYNANQLAVFDNMTSADVNSGTRPADAWTAFKLANGISGIDPNGMVFHCDMKLTADCVPDVFFTTASADTTFVNSNGDIKTVSKGDKFLLDWTHVYKRVGNGDFVIEANYFTLDLSSFPTIASNKLENDSNDHYGSDFSNSTLFFMENDLPSGTDLTAAKRGTLTINNLEIIGNAPQNSYKDDNGNGELVSAGGLIMIKANKHTDITINNTLSDSFFITYFPTDGGTMTVNNCKAYDAFQNTAMLWGTSALTINGSYCYGSGGPMIICQSCPTDDSNLSGCEYNNPVLNVNNTIMECELQSNSVWFSSIPGSGDIIQALITDLNPKLQEMGIGSILNSDSKFNMIGLLMPTGTDASVAQNIYAEGTMNFDGKGLEKYRDDGVYWNALFNNTDALNLIGNGGIMLTVETDSGDIYTMGLNSLDGSAFVFIGNGDGVTTQYPFSSSGVPTDYGYAFLGAAAASNYITITYGGISIHFELYH